MNTIVVERFCENAEPGIGVRGGGRPTGSVDSLVRGQGRR